MKKRYMSEEELALELLGNLACMPKSLGEVFRNVNFDFDHEVESSELSYDSYLVKKGENLVCKFNNNLLNGDRFGFKLIKYVDESNTISKRANLVMDCRYETDYPYVGDVEKATCSIPTDDGLNIIKIEKQADKNYQLKCFYYASDMVEFLEERGELDNANNIVERAYGYGILPDKEKEGSINKNKVSTLLGKMIDNPTETSNNLVNGKNSYQKLLNAFKHQ